MSYIQIKNFGGKDRGLKFNQLSIEIFSKHLNLDAVETSSVYAMFFAGLMGNSYAKREEVDYTFEQVNDWVDELYNTDKEIIGQVNDCFSETQQFKNFIKSITETVKENAEKKS